MDLTGIPFFDVLRARMSWLSTRQSVLSQNVANADTPGYTAKDVKPLDFGKILQQATGPNAFKPGLAVTDPRHIALSDSSSGDFASAGGGSSSITTTGNAVSVEEEMMKVADTQVQYQAATNFYAKAISMMRTAIDRSGP